MLLEVGALTDENFSQLTWRPQRTSMVSLRYSFGETAPSHSWLSVAKSLTADFS